MVVASRILTVHSATIVENLAVQCLRMHVFIGRTHKRYLLAGEKRFWMQAEGYFRQGNHSPFTLPSSNIKNWAIFVLTLRLRSALASPSMPLINVFSIVAILSIKRIESFFNPVPSKEGVR